MRKLYIPKDESELAVIKSLLDSAEIPYFVRNEYFGSLYIGVAMGSFNSKPIFVDEEFYDDAKELLSEIVEEDEFEPPEESGKPDILDNLFAFITGFLTKKS